MKIALVNPYLGPIPGGIERDILQLANEFTRQGDVVTIFATPYEFPAGRVDLSLAPAYELLPGVQVTRLDGHFRTRLRGFQPANPPLWLPGLARAVLHFQPDAVLFFNIGWPLTILPALLVLRRKTTVLYRTAYHANEDSYHRLDPLRHGLQLGVAGLCHHLLTYSHFEKAQIIEHGSVPGEKILPIYPGVQAIHPTPEEMAAFRRLYELDEKVVISHVARLSSFKGTDRLISVLPDVLRRTGQDVVLLLVGRNLEKDLLDRLVCEAGVRAHVRFTGPAPERDLGLAYAVSDLFALPSRYESLGFVFLEAMAHGLPVIGVGTGGVPEVIRNGETGFILDSPDDLDGLADSLIRLIGDEVLRTKLGQQAQLWTEEKFNRTLSTNEVKAILERVAGS